MRHFQVAVIGAGPGGYVAALRAGGHGASVALVEPRELGGACLNRGCIPSKTLLEGARRMSEAATARRYGVMLDNLRLDAATLFKKKDMVVGRLARGIKSLLDKNKVTILAGTARFEDARTLAVTGPAGEEKITADAIIIATGSEPARPAAFPFDGKTVITSDEALFLNEAPKRLLIVGGGYIGAELACVFQELGSDVHLVEMLPRLLPTMDAELSTNIERIFRARRMKIRTGATVKNVVAANGAVTAEITVADATETITVDRALVSVGRVPATKSLALERAGLATDTKGCLPVDAHGRTAVNHIYAIGDVTGVLPLAHVASRQGIIAADNVLGRGGAAFDPGIVPLAVFTHPEIASVGLTEAEAAARGTIKVSRFPFAALGRAHAADDIEGFVKLIADTGTGKLLGAHILGPRATDLIAEMALALKLGATAADIADTVHAHPTFPEAIMEAAEGIVGKPIHA
ncbi:MAG: dihydrolipoyl dehydrogenase [Planctomycetota bacterium]